MKDEVTGLKKFKKKELRPYAYLLAATLLIGLFTYYPFLKTIYLSLNISNMEGVPVEFVGLDNYLEIFNSPAFYSQLAVSLKLVILIAIPSIIIGLILAVLASERLRFNKLFQVVYSLPMAISSSSISIIWGIIFHPTVGIINSRLGLEIDWLSEPRLALITIAMIVIWLNIGLNFIFIFAALRNIPLNILESANIDGVGFMKTLFRIRIPLISPSLFFLVFINIINAFQVFAPIHILTRGGPVNASNSLVYSIYLDAFFNNRFDMASAKSIILFLVMLVFSLLQFKFEKKGVHYS